MATLRACFDLFLQGHSAYREAAYTGNQEPPRIFLLTFFFFLSFFLPPSLCECVGGVLHGPDLGQRHHLHLREPGGSVPQTPDGPGAEADLPGHLQLHQVPREAGV